jgi:transcriptional regulator with XRE-family HTH domain
MTKDQVIEQLRVAVAILGTDRSGQAVFAKRHGMSQQYINDVLNGRRDPGPKVLAALGLERVTTYRRVR